MSIIFSKSYLMFLLGMTILWSCASGLPVKDYLLISLGGLVVYIGGLINE